MPTPKPTDPSERDWRPDRDWRPVPDPTLLTTQQLEGAIRALREMMEARIDGMDRAIRLVESERNIFPSRIDEKIAALGMVHDERFRSVAAQFSERDARNTATIRDSKLALDAALQAVREATTLQNTSFAMAVAKSEAAMMKQIDQILSLVQTTKSTLDEKIDDLKERMTRNEGTGAGQREAKTEGRDTSNYWIGVLGALLGIAGFAMAIITVFTRK